jgi:hypothetical protein
MSSISLRNVAIAVVLTALLGLPATPAAAQPRGLHEPSRVEMGFVTRVWLWLAEIWASGGTADRAQAKSLSGGAQTSADALAPGPLNRAGAFDPNG